MKKLLLIIVTVLVLAYFPILLNNQGLLVFWGDELEQLWPHLHQFVVWIQSGHIPLWNQALGLGSNVFAGLFISLGSPFTWLAALFPVENLGQINLLFDALRFIFIAVFSYLWLKHHTDDEVSLIIGSFIITFSGYIMLWIHYAPFIDPFMGFVLLLYLVEEVFENRKHLFFSFSVVFLVALNPYYFYMFSWFLVFYSLYRLIQLNKIQTLKKFIHESLPVALLYLLGIGLSAFILLPSIYILATNPRIENVDLFNFMPQLNVRSIFAILTSFVSVVSSDYDYNLFYSYYAPGLNLIKPYIYSFVIFIVALYPAVKSKYQYKKSLLIFSLLMYSMLFIPFFYTLFNGNYDARWPFMIVFVNALVAVYGLSNRFQLSNKDWIINAIFWIFTIIVIAGITYTKNYYTQDLSQRVLYHVVFFILWVIAYHLLFSQKQNKFSLIVLSLLLISEGYYAFNMRFYHNGSPNFISSENVVFLPSMFDGVDVQTILESDYSFYRIDVEDGITTEPVAKNYPGFLMYSSSYSAQIQSYYTNRFMPFRKLEYTYSKELAKNLLGAKYYLGSEANLPYGFIESTTGYINPNTIELGFATDVEFNNSYINSINSFEMDFAMYQGVFTENGTSSFEISYPEVIGANLINAGVNLSFDEPGYLIIEYSHTDPYTHCLLDYYENNEIFQQIEFTEYGYAKAPVYLNTDKIYFYCNNQYTSYAYTPITVYYVKNSYIDSLNNQVHNFNQFENIINENDKITADIQISNSKEIVFTNIPYDLGWNIKDNGESIETVVVNEGFLGFYLDKGKHTISFTYVPPFLKEGIIISVISFMITCIYYFIKRKQT